MAFIQGADPERRGGAFGFFDYCCCGMADGRGVQGRYEFYLS
jgi:hypothetical protein